MVSNGIATDFLGELPVPAFLIDARGTVLGANAHAAEVLDRSEQQLAGLSIDELFDGALQPLRQAAESGEAKLRYGDRVFLVRSSPREDGTRSVLLVDVSKLDRDRAEAEASVRERTAFLARLSHEIRSELASMIGFADLLQENVEEANRELAHIITLNGRHLIDTLNSVMELAQIEFERRELRLVDTDVVARVRDRVLVLGPAARDKGLELLFEPSVESVTAALNPTFLDRILHNLIDNAIKYTPAGRVELDVREREGRVWIYVADTGTGFDEAFEQRLFEPFERELTEKEGVGLGLSVTRHLVEIMGGRIDARSEKGSGSTFTVTFPSRSSGTEDRG